MTHWLTQQQIEDLDAALTARAELVAVAERHKQEIDASFSEKAATLAAYNAAPWWLRLFKEKDRGWFRETVDAFELQGKHRLEMHEAERNLKRAGVRS